MDCDTFSFMKARNLLQGKYIYFFGTSNIRALYKDLVWLLEDGHLIPASILKTKNESSFASDIRLSNGILHGGRDYKESREYNKYCHIQFEFITRLYHQDFIDLITTLRTPPDVIVINSCVWDITCWGPEGVQQFKINIHKTLTFLKTRLPSTRIIWLTTPPPSFRAKIGFLTTKIDFLRSMLPWQVNFANKYASEVAVSLEIDVLDLHYHFRLMMNHHTRDGIHWQPKIIRFATNLLLTHVALAFNFSLPGEWPLDKVFLDRNCILRNRNLPDLRRFRFRRPNKLKRRTRNRR